MLDKNQSKVVLPSWVWKGARNEKEAKAKAIEYITPDRYPGYKILSVNGDIAICERENA
ncbi:MULTISPECIES: hypothetical protein [Bacillus cereus group]|uniref:hypothetical protein n=1 Tax=Bacillus cereus group TaxID=86661 RepID=UPI0013D52F36|nr:MULTISPECIES: hypothetical protein [Bacillus cereus group]MBZ6022473.1 hypothetical protein [Bacillus cereus]MDA1747693.1 hypothetical protein [Bacillus cereus group sp. LD121LC]MDA2722246.1 hypothetical protein [Bacillus cereus]MDA2727895.1 hypothetical protein [Bacillus cereus]MDK7418624.1 hypothetical protein [Bacillus paranthracis]